MGTVGSINAEAVLPWMAGHASNKYTQFGEDGLIQRALDEIGETNRQCFEVGAADGLFFSNSLRLREQDWLAVLIESEPNAFAKLKATYGNKSICIHATATDLDSQLPEGFSETADLGVIDIDGQDYWLWHDMVRIRPRVMLVEIHPPDDAAAIPKRGGNGQAGLNAIRELGESKGYTLAARTYCNALFIDSRELTE
jgi:hypothetical protein